MVIFFRDKSIAAIILLVILGFLVHLHFFVATPEIVVNDDDGILSVLLQKYAPYFSGTSIFLIYMAFVLVQAIRLNMVLNQFKMFQQTGFTTAMSYVLLTAFIPQWCALTPALIANSLVVLIFIQLSKLYNHPAPKTLLFSTGLIVGLTVLSYHPTALLTVVVLFALAVVRPFRLTEWLVLVIGIVTPYYFLMAGLFLTDHMNLLYHFVPDIKFNLPVHQPDVWFWINVSAMLLLLLSGFYFWVSAANRMVIQLRKNWSVMLVMLLILLAVPFIFKNAGIESGILFTVPLVSFISNAFLNPKRLWMPNLLFWIAAVIVIHNNWVLSKF
ncbi:hypothetical protein GALL_144570 [mine drainage metagenome]|uniref:Glycosyltransferase RgtA/B/C/D-like domain-containing protein n=1 Tax=mine drainage metagenome TaxID=410659 RepID=A0A1J5S5J2_9ZZZZ